MHVHCANKHKHVLYQHAGLLAVARRFYLLFQMHANYTNAGSASRCLGQVRGIACVPAVG